MSQGAVAHGQTVPSSELQARARRFVDEHGVVGAARRLGLSRLSVASLVGGLRVQQGTLLLADQRLPR